MNHTKEYQYFWNAILFNATRRIEWLIPQAQKEANGELATGNYYRNQLAKALETQATAFQRS